MKIDMLSEGHFSTHTYTLSLFIFMHEYNNYENRKVYRTFAAFYRSVKNTNKQKIRQTHAEKVILKENLPQNVTKL